MSIKKTFARYILASITGMIGLSCYILADTFFVAKGLGADGLTALNLSISIFSFISAIGLLIGIGGATRYSIYQAQNENECANAVFSNSVKLGVITGLIFVLIGVFGSSKLSILLGADSSTYSMTNTYLKVILCYAPFFILNNIFLAFVRNDGAPRLAMIGMLVGSFSNIILDYIFIFPLKLGMFGAAFATGLAPIISLIILLKHRTNKRNRFHFIKTKLNIKDIKYACSLGVSSFITEIASGVILVIFNLLILSIAGNIGVAAYGIVANLALVAVAIFVGIAQGSQPLVSRNFGLDDTKAIKQLFRYATIVSIGISIVLYAFILLFNRPLVEAFNKDHIEVLSKEASTGLLIYFTGFFCAGLNIMISIFLSSINEPRKGFIISILRSGSIIIPVALLLSSVLGMNGVWLSFPLSEAVTLLAGSLLISKSLKELDKA